MHAVIVLWGSAIAFTLAFDSRMYPFRIRSLSHPRRRENCCLFTSNSNNPDPGNRQSRRDALKILGFTAASLPSAAFGGIAELDEATGVLYSPKAEMLSGGSLAARGIPVTSKGPRLRQQGILQNVYETRFIAYLARFLLNFDPSANAWWRQQGFGDSWEEFAENGSVQRIRQEAAFAEFAESVEIGLADYFCGPYGSYSSPLAAEAGLLAVKPAPAKNTMAQNGLNRIFGRRKIVTEDKRASAETIENARKGIVNLYALLQARYKSLTAKRQLAILFSFVSSPKLQPTNEIRALLGEYDNACVSKVTIKAPRLTENVNEVISRTSSRRGGGYALEEPPRLVVSPPPALGSNFVPAELKPSMQTTSRVLRIDVIDGGLGYKSIPQVIVGGGALRTCHAIPVLGREGEIDSIIVLDPGYGYGSRSGKPPSVTIDPPPKSEQSRRARAVASLEYEIVGLEVVRGGNGYIKTEPPAISISPPESDPDWFLAVQNDPTMRTRGPDYIEPLRAEVDEMKFPDGSLAFSSLLEEPVMDVDDGLIEKMQRYPTEMLPASIRPQLFKAGIYAIPSLVSIPQFVAVLSPRYRACDPVFGGVGRVPVTKSAAALSASEYARLALSGAVCTVLVRTALNPLELIKTKQQLLNDEELLQYAYSRKENKTNISVGKAEGLLSKKKSKLGTVDIAASMVELRGPFSLFQSADITFLASLVFGSFGFGATELFRRSFTAFFIAGSGVDEGGLDVVSVLAAASLATVITAAAAAPFEVLRVRSMSYVQPQEWRTVLQDFVSEVSGEKSDLSFSKLRFADVVPLWAGFAPTVSRELPFAVVKFLTFDLIAQTIVDYLNSQSGDGSLPIRIGVGLLGLTISAASGAVAGIAGAIVSHPADLILTKTSAGTENNEPKPDWKDVVKELLAQDGGPANLFVGLPARATFFFLVIGLQFFLYDYVKNVLNVGQDDLSLVLDVFYAVRAGLGSN